MLRINVKKQLREAKHAFIQVKSMFKQIGNRNNKDLSREWPDRRE